MTLFLILGPVAILAGIATMLFAVRGGVGENPKSTAMLIGGMMGCAFGLMLTAFAISMSGSTPITPGA